MKDGVVMSTSVEAVGDLWKVKLPRASRCHVSDVCPVLSLSARVSKHPCAVPLIGNKGFWKRKSDKSGGC